MTETTTDESEGVDLDNKLRRLRVLLTKAESFRQRGEDGSADAALNLAQGIMARYSIDQALLDASVDRADEARDDFVRFELTFTGIYRTIFMQTFHHIVAAFGTLFPINVPNQVPGTDGLLVLGYASDVEHVKILLASLRVQLDAALARFWRENAKLYARETAMRKFKARREFIYSFGVGVAERIAHARAVALRDSSGSRPGTELAVVDRKTRLDRYVESTLNLTSYRTRWRGGDATSRTAGRRAGRSADTGDRQVNGGRLHLEAP